jgi:putative ABC transport system substrate-binding protein
MLANPKRPTYETVRKTVEEAAHAKGRQLVVLDASSERDFETSFATLARLQAGALLITGDPLYLDRRERLVALATLHSIPTIYAWREYVAAGGLMSYGINLAGEYRKVGIYVGKILSGDRPADLPVEQPTTFELVINLKTAKALGLTVPQSILARADEVIE